MPARGIRFYALQPGTNKFAMRPYRISSFSLLLLIAVSCQKDDTVITAPIEGRWQGTLAEVQVKPFGLPLPINDDDPSFATIIEFRSDGTLVFFEGDVSRHGTFTIIGDQLSIETDYTVEDMSLSGTYVVQTLTDTSLVIYLKRNNEIVDAEGMPAVKGDIKITLHFIRS